MHLINLLTIGMCMKNTILSLNVHIALLEGREKVLCGWRMCIRWGGFPGVSRAACGGRAAHGGYNIAPLWFMFSTCWHIVLLDHLPSFVLCSHVLVLSVGEKTASCNLWLNTLHPNNAAVLSDCCFRHRFQFLPHSKKTTCKQNRCTKKTYRCYEIW